MRKEEIKNELLSHHNNFIEVVKYIPADKVRLSKNEKWSPAQQLSHINKSVLPILLAFTLPKILLKIVYGTANRSSKTYQEVIEKYRQKLQAGGRSTSPFIPSKNSNPVDPSLKKLKATVASLCRKIDSFSEPQLDLLILPHPLLGKLTLREMLYFTIYHVQHHQKQIKDSVR